MDDFCVHIPICVSFHPTPFDLKYLESLFPTIKKNLNKNNHDNAKLILRVLS